MSNAAKPTDPLTKQVVASYKNLQLHSILISSRENLIYHIAALADRLTSGQTR